MILLIDQGNSRSKWRVADRRGRFVSGGFWLEVCPTVNELDVMRREEGFSSIVISSVASQDNRQRLSDAIAEFSSNKHCWLTATAECCGVRNAYREPARLGVDRWMALLGARAHGDGAWLVVDAGTAVTVDALAASGRHLGGYIVPGVAMQISALSLQTARVGIAEHSEGQGWGRSTAEAVSRGVVMSLAALIDRALVELRKMGEDTCRVIITGGDAGLLVPHLQDSPQVDPDLVFRGMLVCAKKEHHRPG